MRTGQLYTQDSGSSVTTLHAFRFDCIKNVASKRTPTLRPTLVNPTMKNPKHAAVIADSGGCCLIVWLNVFLQFT